MNINETPTGVLFLLIIILFLMSAFFSGTETALMSLNRYKLKHLSKKNKGAKLAMRLLEKPDRLIGMILIGNNLVNILITQLATYLGFRLGGNAGVAIATGLLTLALLVFAEVTPKTIAALRSEQIALPASYIYTVMLKFAYPLVWVINLIANTVVRLVGVDPNITDDQSLNSEELKTVINEASGLIPKNHQDMLMRVLDMESITVDDIMVSRTDIIGINLADDWKSIEAQILRSDFTRLIIYRGNINNIIGFLHLRRILPLLHKNKMTREYFESLISPAHFTLEGIPLTQQLINFQNECRRMSLVVDEYGDIQGLITLEDILEEIVGQFSTSSARLDYEAKVNEDGSISVEGAMHIRDINRQLNMKLPTDGVKTINGLVTEELGHIPTSGTSILINDYPMEIKDIQKNMIKTLIIHPRINNHKRTRKH